MVLDFLAEKKAWLRVDKKEVAERIYRIPGEYLRGVVIGVF